MRAPFCSLGETQEIPTGYHECILLLLCLHGLMVTYIFQNKASDPPKYKGDKDSMPASMRVKDAAESVLTCIIDQVVSIEQS